MSAADARFYVQAHARSGCASLLRLIATYLLFVWSLQLRPRVRRAVDRNQLSNRYMRVNLRRV